jgi:hypothetical protein
MLAAATEDNGASDPGIGPTSVRIDHIDHHPGDPGIATGTVGIDLNVRRPPDDLGTVMMPAGIDLIGHRDRDDPETGMDSVKTDPSDCQALGELGIRRMTMRVGLIDHRDPDDPGTQRSIEVIDLRGSGDQVDQPHPLHPRVLRLG